jgi:hypothetical protein
MNIPTTTTRVNWRMLAMAAVALAVVSFALGYVLHPM